MREMSHRRLVLETRLVLGARHLGPNEIARKAIRCPTSYVYLVTCRLCFWTKAAPRTKGGKYSPLMLLE